MKIDRIRLLLKNKFIIKLIPVFFIVFIWFIFSSPYFLKQQVPFSSTYLVNFFSPWNAYEGFASPVKNNAMPDVISQIYPWKNFTISAFQSLQIPLWNPYSFSGTPHLANYQSAVLSPFNLLLLILPFIDAWSLLVLLQPLLAGVFIFFYLRSLNLNKSSCLIGSIAFMFCGFITTWMAYQTLAYAISFLPLSLYAIEKYYQTKKSRFLILLSTTLPLSFFSGHFQISIYFFLFVISYVLFKFIQEKDKKLFITTLIYVGIGILFSLPQLLPSFELYSQSLRSSIFAKIEAIPFSYLPTLIAPDFFGNPVTRNDWFGHYAEWNGYVGLVTLMLAIYGLFQNKKPVVRFFIITSILSIFLCYSTPVVDLLVALKVPVLATSAASRIVVLFSFSLSILAAFGLQNLTEDIIQKRKKYILYTISFFAFVFLLLWLIVILKLFMPIDKIIIARQNLILPTILYLITSALFLIPFIRNKILKKETLLSIVVIAVILLSALELLRFANKWMPFEPKSLVFPNVAIVNEFKKLTGKDRLISNLGGEATTYYRLPSIEGYDAVYIKRYGELIASLKNGKLTESERSVVLFPKNGLYANIAVNFLGIKYVIHKRADGQAPWTFPYWSDDLATFSMIYDDGIYQIFENKNAYPRAFLVNDYEIEDNPQKILNIMLDKNFDLRNSIVLEENPNIKLNSKKSSIIISDYSSNKVNINTKSDGSSMLFISDTYYPGWNAYVDGKSTKIYRADYTFRAIPVPKGDHLVEFKYEPSSFKWGLYGFVLGVALLFVIQIMRKSNLFLPKH